MEDDVARFVSVVVPLLTEEAVALHGGDAGSRKALWSHDDPVTLFGAEHTRRRWAELEPSFDHLAGSFTGSRPFEYEVLAAGVSGDLGYVGGIGHSVASRRGGAAGAVLAEGDDTPPTRGRRAEGRPPVRRSL